MIGEIFKGILWNICFLSWFLTLVVFPELDKKEELEKQKQFLEFFKVITEEEF